MNKSEIWTYSHLETLADIAYIAGHYGYRPPDSRSISRDCIAWATEFNKLFDACVNAGLFLDENYMEMIDTFAVAKLREHRAAGHSGGCRVHQVVESRPLADSLVRGRLRQAPAPRAARRQCVAVATASGASSRALGVERRLVATNREELRVIRGVGRVRHLPRSGRGCSCRDRPGQGPRSGTSGGRSRRGRL